MNYILLFLFTLAGIISLTAAKPGGHDKKCPEYKTICLMQGVPTVQICQRGKYVHMMRCDGKGQTCHDGSGQDNQCGQQFTSPVNAHCRDCEVAIHGCLKVSEVRVARTISRMLMGLRTARTIRSASRALRTARTSSIFSRVVDHMLGATGSSMVSLRLLKMRSVQHNLKVNR